MTTNPQTQEQADSARVWTCPTHEFTYGDGVPDPKRMTWSCPTCQKAAQAAEYSHRELHSRYGWWLKSSGVPERYRSATPASIQPVTASAKSLRRAVEAYVANLQTRYEEGAGLLLSGPPGLGKTVGLCAIVNEACRTMSGPIYASWPDVLAETKAAFSGGRGDPRRNAIDRLRNAPVLALDELGVKAASDYDHAELFQLIDWRYRNQLPTLVATNAGTANFAALVGERVADRLKETGPTLVLSGDSLRGQVSIAGPDAFEEPAETTIVRTHEQGRWREQTFHGSGFHL
jgi:DNA replication protein DnaC